MRAEQNKVTLPDIPTQTDSARGIGTLCSSQAQKPVRGRHRVFGPEAGQPTACRFDEGFAPATSSLPDAGEMAPPTGLFLIARLRGEPVGCGGLILHAARPAEIKRMWVAPAVRGVGLGRRILSELERLAGESGASATRLDTNRNLAEAIAMYRSSGYEEIPDFNGEPYAHHWFEKRL